MLEAIERIRVHVVALVLKLDEESLVARGMVPKAWASHVTLNP